MNIFQAMNHDGDEFSNYIQNDHNKYNIPPNDDENVSTKNHEMMETLQENIASRSRSRPFHINPKYSSYTSFRTISHK